MKNKKINIFGGNGFIGSRYCQLTSNIIKNDRNDYQIKSDNVVYFISTISNYNVLTYPFLDIETNLTILINVLESCNKNSNLVFNFISSYFVYAANDSPVLENDHCDPKGFYSITKRTAEQLLESYCRTFNLKYRIIRLSNVLGKQKLTDKKPNSIQELLSKIRNNKDIDLYDCGSHLKDFIHVDDVVGAINSILDKGNTNAIYNVGLGKSYSILELLQNYRDNIGSNSNFGCREPSEFHKNVQQIKNFKMNINKLKNLGFAHKYDSLDKIVEQLCKQSY